MVKLSEKYQNNNINTFTSNIPEKSKCLLKALLKPILALGYLHITFHFKLISHIAYCELLHSTKIKGNNSVISFRESNYIIIHHNIWNIATPTTS